MDVTIDVSHRISVEDLGTGETNTYGVIRGTNTLVPLGVKFPAATFGVASPDPAPEPKRKAAAHAEEEELPPSLVPASQEMSAGGLNPGVLGDVSEDAVGALLDQ